MGFLLFSHIERFKGVFDTIFLNRSFPMYVLPIYNNKKYDLIVSILNASIKTKKINYIIENRFIKKEIFLITVIRRKNHASFGLVSKRTTKKTGIDEPI
jgi:hypothetical protein